MERLQNSDHCVACDRTSEPPDRRDQHDGGDRSSDRDPPVVTLGESALVMPLLQEDATLRKQVVETGRVAVSRITREHSEWIAEPLTTETVEISCVPIGRKHQVAHAVASPRHATLPTLQREQPVLAAAG